MKLLILALTLCISTQSFAEVRREFDENTEKKCYLEMKNMGCVKADETSTSCAEQNKKKLSGECLIIHESRKLQKQ